MLTKWFKVRFKIISLFIGFLFLVWIVPLLYQMDMEPTVYSIKLVILVGFLVSFYDYVKYYSKYQQLRRIYETLEIQLEVLPKPTMLLEEIYQECLYKYNKSLKEVKNQAKKQEAEMVDYYTLWAHQIKVPITAMDLLCQSENLEYKRHELNGELFKIENYVEMVLQYLRIESMSSDMILKKFDLCLIVKKAIKKYSSLFINKKIALKFEPFIMNIYTDEKWLLFVIEQLLSNSLKYTHEGYISIGLSEEKPRTLVIEDTGIGIREEDLPRIFHKGFTGYNGRVDKKSTGIGLYLCKKVVGKLSHQLEIVSTVGQGTKAYLYFEEEA